MKKITVKVDDKIKYKTIIEGFIKCKPHYEQDEEGNKYLVKGHRGLILKVLTKPDQVVKAMIDDILKTILYKKIKVDGTYALVWMNKAVRLTIQTEVEK